MRGGKRDREPTVPRTQLETDRGRKEPGSTESERVIKTFRR